jgi:hypothetical protein
MNALPPSQVATWLLKRFVSGTRNEPLLGDLLEEYRAGRSSFWYWRQVLIAIAQSTIVETRAHKRRAIRAAVMTFLLYQMLWLEIAAPTYMANYYRWRPYDGDAYLGLLAVAGIITGWIVASLHRPHHRALVLFCAAALPIFEVPFFLPFFVSDALHSSLSRSDTIFAASLMILGMLGVLVGGLFVCAPEVTVEPAGLSPEPEA